MTEPQAKFRVLLATDGKQSALEAEELIQSLGNREGIEVSVICVNSFEMSMHRSVLLELDHYSPDAGYEYAVAVVEAAVERLRSAGITAVGRVLDGDPTGCLLAAAERGAFDLVAVGGGSGRWGTMPLLGRVCAALLHELASSLLVVHSWSHVDDEVRVLSGTDGSAEAEHALRALTRFADPHRSSVIVAAVARKDRQSLLLPPYPAEQQDDFDDTAANDHLASGVAIAESMGFSCESRLIRGRPAESLLNLAEREGCGLLVVGSRGLGRIKSMALGSVSDRLVRHGSATLVGRTGLHHY